MSRFMVTVEETAAALRAHRAVRVKADSGARVVAYVAPKVDVTVSTVIGNFGAVIPVEVDDAPGRLVMHYGGEITFTQHQNTADLRTGPLQLLARGGADVTTTLRHLRGVGADIDAFCDAVELVLRGGKPK